MLKYIEREIVRKRCAFYDKRIANSGAPKISLEFGFVNAPVLCAAVPEL
jgi:hypothetical protein